MSVNLDCKTEEEKVNWILINTTLNGVDYEKCRIKDNLPMPPYNYMEEAMEWAMSEDYFPNKSKGEVLCILRKHDEWNKFEAEHCNE